MLFASTRLSLVRELGSEHFGEQIFTERPEELTVEGWKKHEDHSAAERPLTESERDLEGIREAEAREGGGSSRRSAGYGSSGVKIRVADEIREALAKLESSDGEIVMLKIDKDETVVLARDPTSGVSPDLLSSTISGTEPNYTFYRYEPQSANIFIYTCPTAAKPRERMLYASSRANVVAWAEQEAGIVIGKKLEFSDPSELTAQSIEGEFAPKEEKKSGFARPKRPGKR